MLFGHLFLEEKTRLVIILQKENFIFILEKVAEIIVAIVEVERTLIK